MRHVFFVALLLFTLVCARPLCAADETLADIAQQYDKVKGNNEPDGLQERIDLMRRAGKLEGKDAVQFLQAVYQKDGSPRVRLQCLLSLAANKDPKAALNAFSMIQTNAKVHFGVFEDYAELMLDEVTSEEARDLIADNASKLFTSKTMQHLVPKAWGLSPKAAKKNEKKLLDWAEKNPDPVFQHHAIVALGNAQSEKGLDEILKHVESKDYRLRLAAAQALGGYKPDVKVIDGLKKLLNDRAEPDSWVVRSAAVGSIGRLGDKDLLKAMLETARAEEYLRVAGDIRAVLMKALNKDYGTQWGDWEQALNDPEHKSKDNTAVPTYYEQKVFSDHVVFIVDISGSMEAEGECTIQESKIKKSRIEIAKEQLLKTIDTLPEETHFNIVSFNAGPTPCWKDLQQAGEKNKERARDFVKTLSPGGQTNSFDTLDLVFKMEGVDTICFMSDGYPTQGKYIGGYEAPVTEKITTAVFAMNRFRRVRINSVALLVGTYTSETEALKDMCQNFMRDLSVITDGAFNVYR